MFLCADHFEGIEAKVKSALTRAYNSGSHRSQVLVSEIAAKGGKKRAGGGGGGPTYDEEGMLVEEDTLAVRYLICRVCCVC